MQGGWSRRGIITAWSFSWWTCILHFCLLGRMRRTPAKPPSRIPINPRLYPLSHCCVIRNIAVLMDECRLGHSPKITSKAI
ncbi:hypothetical protein BKA64DRAFT_653846 [Cadophora sp. MPI-SDFR-AT-0126]|nr:hypothetical protein BKA64DRAFT_653846 [Leotiomycetes sp. MPI-SDFR-AT-0126]